MQLASLPDGFAYVFSPIVLVAWIPKLGGNEMGYVCAPAARPDTPNTKFNARPHHLMIYVVEDDVSVRKAIGRLMKSAGLPVELFDSAEALLRSARPTASDCLLVDIQLPNMSGLELHQALRRNGSRAPVIFITAFDDDSLRQQAHSGGAAAYFRKPFDDQALLDAIRFALLGADNRCDATQ